MKVGGEDFGDASEALCATPIGTTMRTTRTSRPDAQKGPTFDQTCALMWTGKEGSGARIEPPRINEHVASTLLDSGASQHSDGSAAKALSSTVTASVATHRLLERRCIKHR